MGRVSEKALNTTTCPVCARVAKSEGGLFQHARKHHQLGQRELRAMIRAALPPAEVVAAAVVPTKRKRSNDSNFPKVLLPGIDDSLQVFLLMRERDGRVRIGLRDSEHSYVGTLESVSE